MVGITNSLWDKYKRSIYNGISKVLTRNRRVIKDVNWKEKNQSIYWDAEDTDIDNHADTHCFGKNFRPISFTSEVCTVSPFLSEYKEPLGVPICTSSTAFTLDSGEVIILIFGQGLWFGNRMDK